MKRFSKIVSVIIAAPVEVHIRAMNWACRSVGKPGNGSVITSVPATSPLARSTDSPRAVSAIATPAWPSTSATAPTSARRAPTSSTRPPVIAAAIM